MSEVQRLGSREVVRRMSDEDRRWLECEIIELLPVLFSTALRLTRDHTQAEDLVSDSVAKACQALGQLQDRTAFRGWIFRILMNTFLSIRRSLAARPIEEPLADGSHEEGDFSIFERLHQPFLLWWASPEQEFLDRLMVEDLEKAIADLPESYGVVVVLADVQGYSYAEISEVLEIPIGTVRSRLSRGRGLLQRSLWEHARDAGIVTDTEPPPSGRGT